MRKVRRARADEFDQGLDLSLIHIYTGDFVVIINADKIRVTGTKAQTKSYYRHSGFPGGLKSETFEEAMAKMCIRDRSNVM